MPTDRIAFIFLLSLGAGSLDTATGALLLTLPEWTLHRFGAALPGGGSDILMRFVGAFVLGVGLSYLWGLATPHTDRRTRRLHGVWGTTAVIRASIATFTTIAVVTGSLAPAWLVVAGSDAALAAIQAHGLRARWFES